MSNGQEERNGSVRVSRVTGVRSAKPSNKIIHNQTARRIGIAFKDGEDLFVLPPFGKRTVTPEETTELEHLLGVLAPPGEEVKRLRVILDALTDDEWLAHIRNWRDLGRFQDDIYVVDEERGFGIRALSYTEDPVC